MTTLQQPELGRPSTSRAPEPPRLSMRREVMTYGLVGVAFGIVIMKSQAVSWYRIQEMFRFQSFHMYGLLGSAMTTAFISLRLLRAFKVRAMTGEQIVVPDKTLGRGYRYWIGGMIFGAGWALTGACPGPLFALIGSGAGVFVVTLVAALAGTWCYGSLRPRLVH